jgi:hypothetical protein
LRRIIAFCNLEVEPARFPTILERCNFAFMKTHESQFDPQLGVLWEQGVQRNAFLRQGRAGAWKDTLSPQQAAWFERVFQKELRSTEIDLGDGAFGVPNTEEIRHGTAS